MCTRVTRMALRLGGAHTIFKGSRIEQMFRDGALAPIQAPQADFCVLNIALHELDINPADLASPLKRVDDDEPPPAF